jgi:hypothetical protein
MNSEALYWRIWTKTLKGCLGRGAQGPPDQTAVWFIDASNLEDNESVNLNEEVCSVLPEFVGLENWQATHPFFSQDDTNSSI